MILFNGKKRLSIATAILLGFGAALLLPAGVYAAGAISAGKKKLMVSELMRLSGLGQSQKLAQRDVPPEVFKEPSFLGTLDMQSDEKKLIIELYQKGFKENIFYRGKFDYMLSRFNAEHIGSALRWFRSPAGRRTVQAEKEFASTIGSFQSLVTEISSDLPSKGRLVMADRLENARLKTVFDMKVRVSMLRVVDPLNERFQAASTDAMIKKVNKDLEDLIRTNNLIYILYIYKKLKNDDLEKLASFYESSAGRWFSRTHYSGSLNGFAKINRQVSEMLNRKLIDIDSGKADLLKAKEVFPPGFRFLIAKRSAPGLSEKRGIRRSELAKKRDPFIPLVFVPQDDDSEEDQELVISGEDLEVLPSIPFELYRKIEEMDPLLYQDLEFYGKLFSDKTDLDLLSRDDYLNEVDNYKNLIEKANELVEDMIITPLQTDYTKLALTGFLWSGDDNLALVETPDSKGHSVKEGTLIGPKFGKVESIDQEKIVVVERVRDYLGNITTKTVDIEFPESAEE